ncbi:conserved Plasmodium protein, unknown function, partial [Plasmodium malariae]
GENAMEGEKYQANINPNDSLMITPGKYGNFSNSNNNQIMFYDCKEEKMMHSVPSLNSNNIPNVILKESESSEFLKNTEKGLYSFLYSKNNENDSNHDFTLCLKNEKGVEKYLKVIGEIKVKRNAIFSDLKHNIDLKLLDKSIELTTFNKINYLKCESISNKKYSIHLNAFSDKLDETKFNEFSALHLDYIDNTNFSDLDTIEAFELKKMLFIKYDEE